MERRKDVRRHKKALEKFLCEVEIIAYEAYKAQRNGDEELYMKFLYEREDLTSDFFDKFIIDLESMEKIRAADYYGWKRAYAI